MERDATAAAAALADVDAQQGAVRRRVQAGTWPPPWLGLPLGALAASLAWRNVVLFVVVSVLYLASVLPLVGTPTRLGVVPRHGRRSLTVLLVATVFVVVTPQLAMIGPWWTALIVGAGAAVFVPVLGRWRRAEFVRELPGPAVRPPGPTMQRLDAVVRRPAFVPVATVLMAAAIVAVRLDRPAALLVFVPGMLLLLRRQRLVGEVPVAERTAAHFRVFSLLASTVVFGSPALTTLARGHGGWPLTAGHAAVVAVTVALVGGWQQRRLNPDAQPR